MAADAFADRVTVHAALGDPARLAIVDELAAADRTPSELSRRFAIASNLLAHHLAVLERAGLVERLVSAGDRRRRYVRLRREVLADACAVGRRSGGRALFLCTHNSARSPLAAALWRARTGQPATSAGTHPAERVHPGAVQAARRLGLDLSPDRPRRLTDRDLQDADVVVTVCDRAHEEIRLPSGSLHWSIPDPVGATARDAFDAAASELERRIVAATAALPEATTSATDRQAAR